MDAVFVRTERFNALIDTLGTPELCRTALDLLEEKAEARALIVVNSHMDWDHFWGNAAIAGRAPIIAHAAALDRLRDPTTQQVLTDKAGEESRFRDVDIIGPDITFSGSMVLNGGDLTREIVCHADFAPYNVATVDHEAVGIIDFDTAHPAPRLWDLAYAVYRWAPLSDPANPAVVFGLDEQLRRAEIFCSAYGATVEERRRLPKMICRRLQALVDFMLASAAAGDETFAEDVSAGDARLYLNDIGYVGMHRDRLWKALF